MSHLHLPDGILPFWIVLLGWIVALFALRIALRGARRFPERAHLPRLGFVAALMVVAMSVELLVYHLNLSVVAGILLGPSLGFLAAFLVDLLLALIGHGGVTVIGLNACILGTEVVLGSVLFRAGKRFLSPPVAAWVATILPLSLSTSLMLAVLGVSRVSPEAFEARPFWAVVPLVVGIASLGWVFEATVTAGIVRSLSRMAPEVIGVSRGDRDA